MSKLTELDKEFDEKFVEGMSYIANANKLGTKEAVKSFARKYYEAGKLEEREALKKMVIKARSDALPRGWDIENPHSKVFSEVDQALSDLLTNLNKNV